MGIDWSNFNPNFGAQLGATFDPNVIAEKQNKLAAMTMNNQSKLLDVNQQIRTAQDAQKMRDLMAQASATPPSADAGIVSPRPVGSDVPPSNSNLEKMYQLYSNSGTKVGMDMARELEPMVTAERNKTKASVELANQGVVARAGPELQGDVGQTYSTAKTPPVAPIPNAPLEQQPQDYQDQYNAYMNNTAPTADVTRDQASGAMRDVTMRFGDKLERDRWANNLLPPTQQQADSAAALKAQRDIVDEMARSRLAAANSAQSDKQAAKEAAGDSAAEIAKAGGFLSRNAKIDAITALHRAYPDIPDVASRVEKAQQLNKAIQVQTTTQGKLAGFENTVLGNLDMLGQQVEAMKKSGQTDIPLINKFIIEWKKATGQVYSQGAELYGKELAGELAKLASSATATGAGGTLTDRGEWERFAAPGQSYDQMQAFIKNATNAAHTRLNGADAAIKANELAIHNLWPDTATPSASSIVSGYSDSSKEARYQAWKARNAK